MFSLKSRQLFHASEASNAHQHFSVLYNVVFIQQKHNNRARVKAARLSAASDPAASAERGKLFCEVPHLYATQNRL